MKSLIFCAVTQCLIIQLMKLEPVGFPETSAPE